MKTSNKLLIGLIVAFFLIATILLGIVKYYQSSAASETSQNMEQEEVNALSFQDDVGSRAPIFFPVALLQPLQLR